MIWWWLVRGIAAKTRLQGWLIRVTGTRAWFRRWLRRWYLAFSFLWLKTRHRLWWRCRLWSKCFTWFYFCMGFIPRCLCWNSRTLCYLFACMPHVCDGSPRQAPLFHTSTNYHHTLHITRCSLLCNNIQLAAQRCRFVTRETRLRIKVRNSTASQRLQILILYKGLFRSSDQSITRVIGEPD